MKQNLKRQADATSSSGLYFLDNWLSDVATFSEISATNPNPEITCTEADLQPFDFRYKLLIDGPLHLRCRQMGQAGAEKAVPLS